MSLRILVAAADPGCREVLEVRLVEAGYEPFCASDALAALERASALRPDVCLWGLLGDDGREPLREIARRLPDAHLVGLGSGRDAAGAADARTAQELGLDDWLADPEREPDLALALRRAARAVALRRERRLLDREVAHPPNEWPIVAASPAMIDLLEAVESAAAFPACVLLQGESGTGKEGIARALHAQSARRFGPFVRVGLRDVSPAGAEAEIFGDETRSGCLLDAAGGSLFLDDVDALPPDVQARLVRALEAECVESDGEKPRRVDARVIAATSRNLRAEVRAGAFDGPLAERLAALLLVVPPLRERARDIPLLLDHFVAAASRRLGRPLRGVTDEALARLVGYGWPGNVRELENVVERAAMLARGTQITIRELPERLDGEMDLREDDLALRKNRKRLEAELIRRALRRTGGNRTRAARLLEISHRALLYKLKEYGIRD